MVYSLYGCETAYHVGNIRVYIYGIDWSFNFLWCAAYMVIKPPVVLESLELCYESPSYYCRLDSVPHYLPIYLVDLVT